MPRDVQVGELLPAVALNIETVRVSYTQTVCTFGAAATGDSDKPICHVGEGEVGAPSCNVVDARKIGRIFSLLRGTANPAANILLTNGVVGEHLEQIATNLDRGPLSPAG